MSGNLAYEEQRREELIDGKIVMMSPRPRGNHNRVAFNIAILFDRYLEGKECMAYPDGTDLYLDDENHFVPDFMVVCDPDKRGDDGVVYGAPDLVVEVLSPSTMRYDRGRKMEIYGQFGVREYWLVDPNNKVIEVYRTNGSELVFYEEYILYAKIELEDLKREGRLPVTHFKCSLFDDLEISIKEIFRLTVKEDYYDI